MLTTIDRTRRDRKPYGQQPGERRRRPTSGRPLWSAGSTTNSAGAGTGRGLGDCGRCAGSRPDEIRPAIEADHEPASGTRVPLRQSLRRHSPLVHLRAGVDAGCGLRRRRGGSRLNFSLVRAGHGLGLCSVRTRLALWVNLCDPERQFCRGGRPVRVPETVGWFLPGPAGRSRRTSSQPGGISRVTGSDPYTLGMPLGQMSAARSAKLSPVALS